MVKSLKLFFEYFNILLKRYKIYKTNYFISFMANILFQISGLIILFVIFRKKDIIKNWQFYEFTFYFGFSNLIILLYYLFYSGVYRLPLMINRGEWDKYLIYPYNSLKLLLYEFLDVSRVIPAIFSIFIIVFSTLNLKTFFLNKFYTNTEISNLIYKIIYFLFSLINGIFILGNFTIILTSFIFKLKTRISPALIIYTLQSLVFYPIFIYPAFIKIILTYIFPFAYINYYPALILLSKINNYSIIIKIISIQILLSGFLYILRIIFFNYFFIKYSSTGN